MYFYLTNIIAKGLALIDGFLSEWVDTGTALTYSNGGCYSFNLINVDLNTCGENLVASEAIHDAFEAAVRVVAIIPGLFAVG